VSGIAWTTDTDAHRDAVLELAGRASAPYDAFVHESSAAAERVQRTLWEAGAAEFGPPHGVAALVGDRVVGFVAGLCADDLLRRRLAAAKVLRRHGELLPPVSEDRARLASTTLLRAASGDHYLSRLAVDPSAQGRGLGRQLLARFLAGGGAAHRFVLEVAPGAHAALALYRAHGFEEIARREVTDEASGRRLAYLHLARPAGP
jgi:ribosomal protein S18 acetylase RimI-like enzyme